MLSSISWTSDERAMPRGRIRRAPGTTSPVRRTPATSRAPAQLILTTLPLTTVAPEEDSSAEPLPLDGDLGAREVERRAVPSTFTFGAEQGELRLRLDRDLHGGEREVAVRGDRHVASPRSPRPVPRRRSGCPSPRVCVRVTCCAPSFVETRSSSSPGRSTNSTTHARARGEAAAHHRAGVHERRPSRPAARPCRCRARRSRSGGRSARTRRRRAPRRRPRAAPPCPARLPRPAGRCAPTRSRSRRSRNGNVSRTRPRLLRLPPRDVAHEGAHHAGHPQRRPRRSSGREPTPSSERSEASLTVTVVV